MKYWFISNGERKGPYEMEELKQFGLTRTTKVWRNGLAQWVSAEELPELNDILPPQYYQQPTPVTPIEIQPNTTSDYDEYYDEDSINPLFGLSITFLVISTIISVVNVMTLLAFLQPELFGIAALAMSILCKAFKSKGKYEKAEIFAKKAKLFVTCCIVTCIVSVAVWVTIGMAASL